MNTTGIVFSLVLIVGMNGSALASQDRCSSGYKDFLGKISPFVESVDETALPGIMKRGLAILDACAAGDAYGAAAIWDDMADAVKNDATSQQRTQLH